MMNREYLKSMVAGVLFPAVSGILIYTLIWARGDERSFWISFLNIILNAIQVWALLYYIPDIIEARKAMSKKL